MSLPGMVKSSKFLSILSCSISISYPSIMATLKWGCEGILPVSNSLLQVLDSVSFCRESAGIPTLNTQVADLDSMTPAIFCFELETRWRTWTDLHQSVISQALLQDAVFFFAHLKDIIILLAGNTVLYRTSGVNFCLTAELYQLFTSARNDVDADDPEEIFDQDWIFRNLKYQQLPRFCIIHIIPLIFMRYIYSFIYLFIECSSFFLAFTHHLSILILAGSISPILGRTGRSGNKEADFVEGNDEYGGPKHESKAWLWWRSWEKKDSCWL